MKKANLMLLRIALSLFTGLFLLQASVLNAHPHSWVSVLTEIEGDNKQLTGLRMFWTFDLITTSDALSGKELTQENQPQVLKALASEMLINIKESHYFTHLKIHEQALNFKIPESATLTLEDYKLTLSFFLALEKALPLPIVDLNLQIYEDSYFVDFLWLLQDDIQLSENFHGDCKLDIVEPPKNNMSGTNEPLSATAKLASEMTAEFEMYDPLFIPDPKLGEKFTQRAIINCL